MSQLPVQQRQDPVEALLFKNIDVSRDVLPKFMNPEKMARLALRTIRTNPVLARCTPASLVSCIMEAGAMGLEIDMRGLAYLVPFKNEATLMIGYKGLMELAYRSGKVSLIFADIVCSNDQFEYELGLYPKLRHVPALGDRGRMLAVYAVAKMTNGDPQFVVMSMSEIEEVRKASRAGASSPWNQWYSEMSKKTAIRRLCKYLPLSADVQRAISIDEAGERGENQFDIIVEEKKSKREALTEAIEAPVEEPQPKRSRKKQEAPAPAPATPESEDILAKFDSMCADLEVSRDEGDAVARSYAMLKHVSEAQAKTFFYNNQNDFCRYINAERERKQQQAEA